MKRYILHSIPLLLAVLLLIGLELNQPRQIDWSPSFGRDATSPYGTYLLYDLLQRTTPPLELTPVSASTFEALDMAAWDGTNYVVINEEYDADEASVTRLLEYVESGNDVFIAANELPFELTDTLGLDVGIRLPVSTNRLAVDLANPALARGGRIAVRNDLVGASFDKFDTARSTVLARLVTGEVIFLRVPYGSGHFLLSTTPSLFTNYAIVDSASGRFPFAALSYLSPRTTYWDDYYKRNRAEINSPLRFLLGRPSLSWMFYLTLATGVLFVLVYGRRRQRIVPIITPHPNLTMSFVTTVGRLYFLHGDHRNLAEKKILHLSDHIQSRYGLRASSRSAELYERLAARSGRPIGEITSLFETIDSVERKPLISADELTELTSKIDSFYTNRTAS